MNAPFAWPGGKRGLKVRLLERMPEHKIYVEVFGGSGKLLFAKKPSESEILNDINGDVINFFRVTKHRAAELAELLEQDVVHPSRFRDLETEASPDEMARALRFIYRTWYSFAAIGRNFAAASLGEVLKNHVRRPLSTVRELLEATGERLRRVRIEQRDFAELIRRFDTPDTFFYLDPPYVHYQANGRYDALEPVRREELFKALAEASGSFTMSFDDCAEVRALATHYEFEVEEVPTKYSLAPTSERKAVVELLVSRESPMIGDLKAGEEMMPWAADPMSSTIAELLS